jgi:hypothetical protein
MKVGRGWSTKTRERTGKRAGTKQARKEKGLSARPSYGSLREAMQPAIMFRLFDIGVIVGATGGTVVWGALLLLFL